MSLITTLIAIIIAGGLSYLVKISPLGQVWKVLAWGIIAIFFLVWLLRQFRAAGIDMTI
jgi:hypothetical protein